MKKLNLLLLAFAAAGNAPMSWALSASTALANPVVPTAPTAQAALPTAATVLTLEQLTQVVLAHNPALQAVQSSVQGARAGVTSAAAWHNPKVEWQQGRWQPSGLPQQATRGWGVSQFIENPGVRQARIDAAQSSLAQSGQLVSSTRNDLVAQVHTRAYEAQLYQSEAESAAETLSLLEEIRERIRVRVESGEAARYEMIKADAEVIHARERQQTAAMQAQQALLELNRLAAGHLPARWKLNLNLQELPALPGQTELQAQAQKSNPELLSLEHELERTKAQLRAAKSGRWPGLEMRYSDNREPEIRQSMLGVSVQIPLVDQRSGPIAEAQAAVERASIKLDGRRLELQQQMLLAWRSLEIAQLRVDALGQGVIKEAEAALKVAQAAYRFGERGILDVLDAQRVLRSIRSDLLQARYQLQVARITLEQLSGRYAATS